MAPGLCWQDPVGLETINRIVKKVVPKWTTGLHPIQLELVSVILDGADILCGTATGDGKSAAFSIPSLVLSEYNKHPEVYPTGLSTRKRPIGIIITPTKGLADNIVRELSELNVAAFSFCKESITEARKAGRRLAEEIKDCALTASALHSVEVCSGGVDLRSQSSSKETRGEVEMYWENLGGHWGMKEEQNSMGMVWGWYMYSGVSGTVIMGVFL